MNESERRPAWERYGVAVGAVAVVTLLRWIIQPVAGPASLMSLFYFAVIGAAWWGGFGAGMLALGLSLLVGNVFFMGVPGEFAALAPYDWAVMFTFAVVNFLVCGMVEALHRARRFADIRARDIQEKHEALEQERASRERAEEQLEHIVNSVRDVAIMAMDSAGRIVRWSSGAVSVFGYLEEEVLGQPGELIFTPEDRDSGVPAREMQEVWERGWTKDERLHVRKDGVRFYGSGSIFPIRDESGKITGFTKVMRDATQQWVAERGLRESEENFRALFETAAAGMVQVDSRTGAYLRVNRCFCKITGYSEEELKGLTFSGITHPDERSSDFETFQRMVRGESAEYAVDKRYVRKDGRIIWVHVTKQIVRDDAGQPKYAVGVVQDITERHLAERSLAEAEERFRLGTEISGLGTWTTNLVTGEVTLSTQVRNILGVPEDTRIGADMARATIHPDDRPELERRIAAARDPAGPGTYDSEHRIKRPDGVVRWVQARGLTIFAGEGVARRAVRSVGAVLDITERKEALERMRRREEAIVALTSMRSVSVEGRIRQVTETAAKALDVARVGVWLYTPDGSEIQCEDLYQRATETHERGHRLAAEQYPEYFAALARGVPIMADDACSHGATSEFLDSYLKPLGICSMLDVPIWVGGRLAGVVCHEHTGTPRHWTTEDQEFAASLATTAALALEAEQRRLAEEALASKERQLRQIGDNLPGVLYQMLVFPDGHSKFLYFSAGLERETGLSIQEALHDENAVWSLVLPEALPKLIKAQAESVRTMTPLSVTVPLRHRRTGEIRWAQMLSSPEKAGAAVLFNGVALDVTVQRKVEEAFAEAEERLRLAAKAGGVGTFDTNYQTGDSHWSPEMKAILGVPADVEMSFEQLPALVHPEDRQGVADEIERAFAPEGTGYFESMHRVLHPDGSVRWVRVSGRTVFVGEGKERCPARTLGAALDITALKEAEEAARENSERFRTLADNISQLAWMADKNAGIFWYNRRWFDYTGANVKETMGWGWQKLVDPAHVERVVNKFRCHLETGEVWEDTYPVRGRDGSYRWFLSRAVPIRDEKGRVSRWFGTNTDITEQRRIAEELREADRRKSEFLAMLGHELRNPLAAIRNALVLWEEEHESFEWARGVVERQSAQLARLVDDLLDVSRIARGKVALRREPVEVCQIVERAVEAARPLIAQRRHGLSVDCPGCELWVDADPGRLEQIIGNLLTNAAKYTEPGGTIAVTVSSSCAIARHDGRTTYRPREQRGGKDSSDEITITVCDTGIGIAPEKMPQMFEIFTQAERSLDRAEGGLGLGLAIVKMLTEMHGGRVTAWSAGLSKGSTFSIHLPALPAPDERHVPEPAGAGGALKAPAGTSEKALSPVRLEALEKEIKAQRVLVVDDNVDAAHALGRLLRRSGCELEIALDGLSALERAREFHPTAVLLDIGLPGMNGYDVARQLRAEESGSHALLVAITGYGQDEDRRRSQEAGFDRHLVKPVDIGEIKRIIGEAQAEQIHAGRGT